MNVVYAMQPIPEQVDLFLAGPTPRSQDVESWRPAALVELAALGFGGTVLVPEDANGSFHGDYLGQIDWETEGLQRAACVLFWVPRNLKTLPGLTTNDEWGFWKASGKVVFGAPPEAEKVKYQTLYCTRHRIPCSATLKDTCSSALQLMRSLPCYTQSTQIKNVGERP
jgi:hypothetical protein